MNKKNVSLKATAAAVSALLAGAAYGVEIASFSSDMLAASLQESGIRLCDFENGALGWGLAGVESVEINTEDARAGEACLSMTKAPSAQQVELMRRFLFHENFKMLAIHVWIAPGEKPPLLEAVVRDERGALKTMPMERNDDPNEEFDELMAQIDGAWMRFALMGSDVLPKPSDEPFHGYMRSLKPDPVYLEAIRIKPQGKSNVVMVDDMFAVLSDKTVPQPLYLVTEFDDSGAKPAVEAKIYNAGKPGAKRKASPLRLAVEIRDVDTPLWEIKTQAMADVPEPQSETKDTMPVSSVRVELGSALPAGGYMLYSRLQEEAKDKDKTVYPTRHTAVMFLAPGADEQERTLEDFAAAGNTDNWLVETNRRGDEDMRLANARAGGRVSLDATITPSDGNGGKSLKISSKSGRASELLVLPVQLSAGVKKVVLRLKTVKGGGGRELVMHVAGRNGDIIEYVTALGNPSPEWKEAEFALGSGFDSAPLSIFGFALRGGEAEVLLDEIREAAIGEKNMFSAAFSADAPRVMLGVHRFADMFRTIEARHCNPIPDYWRGNEVYFEAPTGVETDVSLRALGASGELSYRFLGSGTNVIDAGAVKLDAAGKGKVKIAPPSGGLYVLEVSDGKSIRYCRFSAIPSRGEQEEMLAAQKAFASGPAARPVEFSELEKIAVFESVRAYVEKRRSEATEEKKNDYELRDDAIWFIRSALTPALVIDAPAGDMCYFADQDILGMGGPTHFAYQAGGAVKVVKGDTAEKLNGMTGNWILTWFNGAEGWDKIRRPEKPSYINVFMDTDPLHIDYPHLILFNRKPESARLAGKDGLEIKLGARTTTLCVPLYGCWKRFAEHTLEWGNGLPADVVKQCDHWEKFLAYVPVDVREYYAIDVASGDVMIKNVYDFLSFRPGAKPSAADLAAPAPPAAALVADCGGPIEFDDPAEDMNAATMMGPYKVIPGRGECNYRFKNFLRYVHEVEYAKPGEPLEPKDWQAVARRGWLGDALYYQFVPGDQNYYVYERAARVVRTFPYMDKDKADMRDRARRYLYRVSRDYFVEPSCFTGGGASGNNRAVNTSREGGWWGDRLKHTTASVYSVWQMAYFGGMWQMIADRWDLVRRMNSADQTWLIPGPTSWAEHYHHGAGPGSIAAARMALVVGDMKEYAYNVFLAAKIWIGEAAWIQGAAPYIRERQPWNQSYQKDAIPVVLDTVWGFHLGGINENGVSPYGGGAYDGIHENFWVWGSEELIRFWRDYLKPGTKHILDACSNRAYPGWENFVASDFAQPGGRQPSTFWSLLKMKMLVMEEPEKDRAEYMRKRAFYTEWTGPDGGTSLAHVMAILKNGYEYKRVLPLPAIEARYIKTGIPFGGGNWIEGGGPWAFSPAVKGLGMYQATFVPPKPMEAKWDVMQNAMFAGFHRAWPADAEISAGTVDCGKANVQVWHKK